jgi:hypothetical protein
MIASRCSYGLCLLSLLLVLAAPGWAQTAAPPSAELVSLYRQAVSLLDQAEKHMTEKNLSGALAQVKQANELFTRLQKESAAALAERELSPQDSQQLAINQKLAGEAQAQADALLETAAAKGKQARELKAQGKVEAGDAAYQASRDEYLQAQNLSIKSAIYALRNQQIIFRFLAP